MLTVNDIHYCQQKSQFSIWAVFNLSAKTRWVYITHLTLKRFNLGVLGPKALVHFDGIRSTWFEQCLAKNLTT